MNHDVFTSIKKSSDTTVEDRYHGKYTLIYLIRMGILVC